MSGLSVPLLLILSAIALACAVVLWRYRMARPPRKASSGQAQQRERTVRSEVANASARATGGIVNAPNDPDEPRPVAQGAASAPLTRIPAATASVPASVTDIAESQGDDAWLDTVPGEQCDRADSVAPVAALLPSPPAANERVNANASPAPEDGRNADREQTASQAPVIPPLAEEQPTVEEAPSALRQPAPDAHVPAVPAAVLATQPAEAVEGEPEPGVSSIDRAEEQLKPPMQAWGTPAPLNQTVEEPLAAEEEPGTAQKPLPKASFEPEPVADQEGPHRDATASGDEPDSSSAERDGQQLSGSEQAANEPEATQGEEAFVAAEAVAAVDRSQPAANDPVPEAMTATAADAQEPPVQAGQPASPETIPFDPSVAPDVLSSPSAVPIHSEVAQAEAQPNSIAQVVRFDPHVDEPKPVLAGQVEAAFQAKQLKADSAVLPEQRPMAQADEAVELVQKHVPALEIGGLDGDPERESTTGRKNDLQPSEREDAAQPEYSAKPVDDTAEESPGAVSELDDQDELLRDALSRPARQAVHRDRRGRQTAQQQPGTERKRAKRQSILLRPPAEARLRLVVHPIRRTVGLALVLLRPAEFPEQVTLELNGSPTIDALEESQYGDVDLTWDTGLLLNEIRVSCAEGYQWVRGARPVHIFAADPAQADLVSVPAATAGTEHTVICREQDTDTVCDIAESAGSVRPQALRRFSGIPDGWVVLSGYRPTRAAALPPVQAFSPLDPGHDIEITLQGGLETGRRQYAQGRPPRIHIEPMLDGISVLIGGVPATVSGEGNWEAPGWDAPGQHRIEVVPGPSLNYEVQADPGEHGGWTFWDAHSDRTVADESPWSRAQICGALLAGPSGERVIAAELQPTVLALGIDGSIGALRPRPEAGVSVGFAAGTPAFLLFSSGRRRRQGKIVWLGLPLSAEVVARPRRLSQLWIDAVRTAAARRLAMQADEGGTGQSLWEKAVLLARSAKRRSHG